MSVRGERVVYREREREVDYDEQPQRRSYTTIKRYQVPDRDSRTDIFNNIEDVKEDKLVIRRERDSGKSPRSEVSRRGERDDIDIRITERTGEREREPERRDVTYRVVERDSDRDRYSSARSDFRFVEREREVIRASSPPAEDRVREYRFERERDYSPARTARQEREYDVERYSKTTDYYQQPQPIIIRESQPQPIIIREERRGPQQIIIRRDEPAYEIIERDEVREDQQLIVKDDPPASTVKSVVKSAKSEVEKPQEEDYYYERRIREIRRRDDDVKPSDSASQHSSEDSYEYIRRERYIDDDRDRHHKLHLAEGAIAGAAAGEILRQHRKSQGKGDGHRGRDLLGGAALGAIGAEAISRAKSLRGSSRRRDWDEEDDRRSRRGNRQRSYSRSRSRSRSRSKSRVQKLGGLAAVAAVGALAGYAIKKSGQNKETVIIKDESPRRRSRSRRRRASVGPHNDDRATNPEHRNRRIAQAGLASAAAAGIWERLRSKSRGGRERSKSRIRTAAPIVGAGLGGAALAGLYERNKASKEQTRDAIIADERNRGRRRSSRSRSRSRAPYAIDDGRRRDGGFEYGADPVPRDGRYYDDEAPGSYRRRGNGSAGSSPDTRHRSRSRGRDFATAGAGALAGAAIAHQAGRSRSRNRNDRDHDYDRYSDEYAHGDYITPPPNHNVYPSSYNFPPPPTGEHAAQDNSYAPYNPSDYPPAAAGAARDPYPANGGAYGESAATLGAPNPHDPFIGDNRYVDPVQQTAEARERQEEREMRQARERDPGNVSSAPVSVSERLPERADTSMDISPSIPPSSTVYSPQMVEPEVETIANNILRPDGVNNQRNTSRSRSATPRGRSTSRVRFDLGSNVMHSPDEARRGRHLSTEETSDDSGQQHRHARPGSGLMHDPYERRSRSASDETVDLPPRFDQQGNRTPEHSDLASRLSDLFGSSQSSSRSRSGENGGAIEDMLKNLAGQIFRDDHGRSNGRLR